MSGVELLMQRVQGGAVVTQASVRKGQYPRDGADYREFVRSQPFMQDVVAALDADRQREQDRRARFMEEIVKKLDRAAELGPLGPMATIPPSGYVVNTGTSAIALTGTTAKTIMYLLSGTSNPPSITEFSVGFDGVTASNVSALVEFLLGTGTNSTPGTNSTSFTPVQIRVWPPTTPITTAANNCTTEPTTYTVAKPWLVTPNAGLLVVQFPLGREPTGLVTASTSGKVLALRATAPNNVNTRGYFDFEE